MRTPVFDEEGGQIPESLHRSRRLPVDAVLRTDRGAEQQDEWPRDLDGESHDDLAGRFGPALLDSSPTRYVGGREEGPPYFVITNENVSEIDLMPDDAWGSRVANAV